MKAALGELLAQVRRAAVHGVVPERVFAAQVRALGLGDAERERLRVELARLGLSVQASEVHTDADSVAVNKVVQDREESVSPRGGVVRALLRRYADSEGYVTSRAVDGVARLAGLGGRETAELRAGAMVRDAVTTPPDREEETVEPLHVPSQETESEAGDLAAAVAAALVVMDDDRVRRRAENYLLKADAEVGLAVLVRGGADRIAQEPDAEALRCLPHGDIRVRARDCLVLHNQRLVHKLVPRYLDQGLDYEDLFQNGVLGLMRAARKFDPAKGFKFSTYATWWIRQSISRAIADEGALIRIPVHMHEQIRKVAGAERTLAGQGRSTRAADVAVFCDMSVVKVEEARRLSRRTDSLDRVIGDGTTLGELVGRTQALPSVEQVVLNALQLEQVMAVVDSFSTRDARVLVRRLGLDGDDPSTLDDLGREFGVTRERIRQVEVKARVALKDRLRKAGIVRQYEDGPGQETDEEKAGPTARRSAGNAPVAAVTQELQSEQEEREALLDLLPAPVPEQALTPQVEEGAVVAEESGEHGVEGTADVLHERTASAPAALPDEPSPSIAPVESPSSVTRSVVSGTEPYTADWEKVLRIPTMYAPGEIWLAEYALLAVGHRQLTLILGTSAADAADCAVRDQKALDRPVIMALEVLQRVFDAVKEARLRPEDFFDRSAEALVGLTPLMYLAKKPLVQSESRLAVRDALREFVAEMSTRREVVGASTGAQEEAHGISGSTSDDQSTEPQNASDDAPLPDERTFPADAGSDPLGDSVAGQESDVARAEPGWLLARLRAEADQSLAAAREEHEAQMARLRDEHQLLLADERDRAEARVAAAHADTERQIGAQEEALLRRVDKSLLRQEQHLRKQADERIARLEEEHREAQRVMAVRTAGAQQRVYEADQRLRRQREEAEVRIEALEERLRQTEGMLVERDAAVRAAHQEAAARANAAEQRAAQSMAQTEHDAWARISELQEQLAAERGATDSPASFRERWRRP